MGHYCWRGEVLHLRCHVQPGARENAFCGLHGDRLKLRLKAAPVDGKANKQLLLFLAAAFDASRGNVSLVRGSNSRLKEVAIRQPRRLPEGSLVTIGK